MKSWNTQASKDDGVDAVAVNEDPVFGGLCVIQAKRYRGAVGVEPVRALARVMEDKHASKGIMVTTSWVTKDGHAFAPRHGRIQIIECEEIKYLCKEHLGPRRPHQPAETPAPATVTRTAHPRLAPLNAPILHLALEITYMPGRCFVA